jgi:hypothetical protein
MKVYNIFDRHGEIVAVIHCASLRVIEKGVDFQPNLFNGYHAVEIGAGRQPAVLNLPLDLRVEEEKKKTVASEEKLG